MKKLQHTFKCYKYGTLTFKVKKISSSGNSNKSMQTLDCRKPFVYGTSKDIINKNYNINKCKILTKKYK